AVAGYEPGAQTPDSYTLFYKRLFQTDQTSLIDKDQICSAIPTYCSTFSLDNEGEASLKYLNNDNNYNYFITSPEVECTAINCEYNQGEICYAPHVKIVSAIATAPIQTECQTFIPREGLYSAEDVSYTFDDVHDDLKHDYDQTYNPE
ncbi:MAG TPA: DUF1540 domain-containing protein, partial [Peptococcaceae bacterium]|nr:DUF1540 domain-containing protein [Peptococcaceae bacterium]